MKRRDLDLYYQLAVDHRLNHDCGGVPYADGSLLSVLTAGIRAKRILELGTGVGYSTACLLFGSQKAKIETIDQDSTHIALVAAKWKELGISSSIQTFSEKAEAVLPALNDRYDFIFFDGYDPSMKFLTHFERMLEKGGILVTANLFFER